MDPLIYDLVTQSCISQKGQNQYSIVSLPSFHNNKTVMFPVIRRRGPIGTSAYLMDSHQLSLLSLSKFRFFFGQIELFQVCLLIPFNILLVFFDSFPASLCQNVPRWSCTFLIPDTDSFLQEALVSFITRSECK